MADGSARKGHWLQMLGSLAAALLIAVLAIWAVTARLGPTSIAAQEAAEERQEDAAEEAEDAAEEAAEAQEEGGRRRRRGRE